MSGLAERVTRSITALFVVVQALSMYFVWTLITAWSIRGAETFALYIGVDLVTFAMISYMYRKSSWEEGINRRVLVPGCAVVLLLVFASLFI